MYQEINKLNLFEQVPFHLIDHVLVNGSTTQYCNVYTVQITAQCRYFIFAFLNFLFMKESVVF